MECELYYVGCSYKHFDYSSVLTFLAVPMAFVLSNLLPGIVNSLSTKNEQKFH